MQVKEFELINEEKVERAIKGTPVSNGGVVGGVMKSDGTYDEKDLLAEYDRLGGLIIKAGDRVKTGSFYDFANKKVRKEPEIVFIFNVNGNTIEVEDGQELPGIVKAARILEGKVEEKKKKDKK